MHSSSKSSSSPPSNNKARKMIKAEQIKKKIRSERDEATQKLNLAKTKVEDTATTLAILKPTNTKTTFFGARSELCDYVLEEENLINSSDLKDKIKSKKNQLEEAEVIENQLKVNISNLNKKEEELKVPNKRKMDGNKNKGGAAAAAAAAPADDDEIPSPTPPKKYTRVYVVQEEEDDD